jgi:hypothetical protein
VIHFVETSTTARPAGRPLLRPRSGAEWADYFRRNAVEPRPVPWERGAEVAADELAPIARSLQAWQLGETSDGRHLLAAMKRYAARIGDPDYVEAVAWFIREEQRHGESLGRWLDLAGVGRRARDWGDALFRAARYGLRSPEAWTTPVVMVETLATVYYDAIRRATGSAVLRAVCRRILADEGPHLRFQCERLAKLYRGRPRALFHLTMLAHRAAFLGVMLLVWAGHRRALRAGGYGWRRYWRKAWDRMAACWRLSDPRRYEWPFGQ